MGGFSAPTQFSLGNFASDLTLADFNNDGKLDLAVAIARQDPEPGPLRSSIAVLLGNGAGAFGAGVTIAAERTASRIVAGDLNGDARPDIITANQVANNLTVALNTCGSSPPSPPTAFTISGVVRNANFQAIAGVAMNT